MTAFEARGQLFKPLSSNTTVQAARQTLVSYREKSRTMRHERSLVEEHVQEKQAQLDYDKRQLQNSRASCAALHRDYNVCVFCHVSNVMAISAFCQTMSIKSPTML